MCILLAIIFWLVCAYMAGGVGGLLSLLAIFIVGSWVSMKLKRL